MLTHEIQVNETKYSIIITDQIVYQVNNLKSLYNTAYEDPESSNRLVLKFLVLFRRLQVRLPPKQMIII